ncbi:phage/plasmid replication domain-containing protein, partial [Maribacter flavus]
MYDTVNLWLPFDKIGSYDLNKTCQNLTGITEHKKDDGQVYLSGYLDNYKVSISGQGVSF